MQMNRLAPRPFCYIYKKIDSLEIPLLYDNVLVRHDSNSH